MNIDEHNKQLLIQYFKDGIKDPSVKKLGVEVEHFVVKRQSLESVSYYGKHGIEDMLEDLSPLYPYRFEKEGHLLGLYNEDYSLSLEPAGQLEISINPQVSIDKIERIYMKMVRQLKPFLHKNNYQLVEMGYQPASIVEKLKMIPKKRYEYMDKYFKNVGTGGIHMMRGTASAQVAIDYYCEEDFVLKYRVAYALMPLLSLLTSNTPFYKGRPFNGFMLRNYIWENVDSDRTGMINGVFDNDFGFDSYAEYLMNLPLIFMPTKDGEEYVGAKNIREIKVDEKITKEDVDHILSMTFVDVRLKNYIEIRFADSMEFEYVKGFLALVKGVFYNEALLHKIVANYKCDEESLRLAIKSLSEDGFDGLAYGRKADELLTELIAEAKEILGHSEQKMLEPFEEIVANKKTLTEEYDEKTIS